MKDPREAAHIRARPDSHLLVPVVHYPRLPLAVQRIRRRKGDVEPLRRVRTRPEGDGTALIAAAEQFAWPVSASAVAHHCQEVVGREEAADRDEDEQAGRGLAGILPPDDHRRRSDPTRGRVAPRVPWDHSKRGAHPVKEESEAWWFGGAADD